MHAFVGLGSNLGDRLGLLRRAVAALGGLGQVLRRSAVYETPPQGVDGPDQPDYLNAAVLLLAPAEPLGLLGDLLGIEASLGRVRDPAERCAPRTLDLDLLLLGERGELVLLGPALVVPHPRLHQRTFVLRPLLDLDADLVHPVLGLRLSEVYRSVLDRHPAPRLVTDL